jgi:hypothetical protein
MPRLSVVIRYAAQNQIVKWELRVVKNCPRRQRYLAPTVNTLPASQPSQFMSTSVPALRTHKTVRPSTGSQV